MFKSKIFIGILLMIGWVSCGKAVIEEWKQFPGFQKPEHFPEPKYDFSSNPVTKDGFELGRRLFYDPRLSRNNTISCGSCHIQSAAFTHHGHDVSHGIDDRLGTRNATPIMNLAWNETFMWDGGVFNLDLFPFVPITHPDEMDEKIPNVLQKLKDHPEYPGLFEKAFGSSEITSTRMMKALSQFMVMAISNQSKYDSVQQGKATFSAEENKGYVLFQQHCGSCHKEPLFTDQSFRDNGIGVGPNGDEGRKSISLKQEDLYKFKVPSLRNLRYTRPYMHDGRMLNLQAVIDHYTDGLRNTPNLDPLLTTKGTSGFGFTTAEKNQLIAFLRTLDDPSFVTNPLLSE
jgi:cytochrome c peroxidase